MPFVLVSVSLDPLVSGGNEIRSGEISVWSWKSNL